MEPLNLVFIGDELVAGYGDARALGWTGRVLARTRGVDALGLTLAVPGETTAQLASRWHNELARRTVSGRSNRLIVGIGVADVLAGISPARSRLALANILDVAASEQYPALVVGPPPLLAVNPDATARLSTAVQGVCTRRGIPYVETFNALRNHDQWEADVLAAGGMHPAQAGYGLLAWLVLHRGWYEWLKISEPSSFSS